MSSGPRRLRRGAAARILPAIMSGRRGLAVIGVLGLAAGLAGCDPQQMARDAGAVRRLSVATGGTGGVYYPYGGAIARVIDTAVDGVEATAEVTGGSVDNLKFIRDGRADLAFTLVDTLADAVAGRGPFADGAVPARTLAVLYQNRMHLACFASSGIGSLEELRGRVVSTGSPGSGTEVSAIRILEAAGLDPDSDVSRQALGAGDSADALRDGKIDAFFWSGGVPTAAILDLSTSPGRTLRLLPSAGTLGALRERWGEGLYAPAGIEAGAYPGLEENVPVVGVSNALAVSAELDDALAYAITRALFEQREELVAVHSEARELTLATAVTGSPVPFHPGAIRYYREQGAWPE